jgi:hypothetical protein
VLVSPGIYRSDQKGFSTLGVGMLEATFAWLIDKFRKACLGEGPAAVSQLRQRDEISTYPGKWYVHTGKAQKESSAPKGLSPVDPVVHFRSWWSSLSPSTNTWDPPLSLIESTWKMCVSNPPTVAPTWVRGVRNYSLDFCYTI